MNKSITQVLNSITAKSIRWCTPSILLSSEKIKNLYKSDMSVSFEKLGFPSEPSGIFLTAYRKAASAYGSDGTLFSVYGTTGSNFIVLRTLAKQIPNLRILAQRNIHKSILNACQDYGINLLFLETNIDPHLQVFLPNKVKNIVDSIQKIKPNVFLITNPTYEGLTIDLKELIKSIRQVNSEIIIFIEEAWGSHLSFSDKLPDSAMYCGADICVQSTHKQGGSLQQGGMIHWKGKRINLDLLLESYGCLSTSSPSYILLASLDAAREEMEKNGRKRIEKSLQIAKKLSSELEKIPGFRIIRLLDFKKKTPAVFAKDNTKILVDVSKSGWTGFSLAKIIQEKYNIIVEKCSATTLLFLVPFQTQFKDVKVTANALMEIVNGNKVDKSLVIPSLLIPKNIHKVLEMGEVAKLLQNQIEIVSLKKAKGRISAENITPYPPGIPTTIQGEEFNERIIMFYENIRQYPNSHIVARDITLRTVLVVK